MERLPHRSPLGHGGCLSRAGRPDPVPLLSSPISGETLWSPAIRYRSATACGADFDVPLDAWTSTIGRVPREPIYVETLVRADLDRVWELTQNTDLHPRWDLRFSKITPTGTTADGADRFRYELHLPLHCIAGTAISLGERRRADGTRTSALRFTTRDRLSPLGDGRGYWRYVPTADGVRFLTGYDYRPGWGRAADALGIRWFVGWMTAWSFDRLRIWAETGQPPEAWPWWSVLAVWRGDRPRASRCRRQPVRGRAMDDSPATLATLPAP